MEKNTPYIALGSRLRGIPEVLTLGVKPNFPDYTAEEQALITAAPIVLYPTLNYAQFFTTIDKKIFPSLETYLYADNKIKQTTLFSMLGLPHPRTRFYYRPQIEIIRQDFSYPFIAKIPRASARGRGVFLVHNTDELVQYLRRTRIAYIQEYLPHDRDLRVVLINYKVVIAYWRRQAAGEFRANLHQGGTIDFNNVPSEALRFAQKCARACRLNDVGLDFLHCNNRWHLIEANMQYGRLGLAQKGLVLKEVIRQMLLADELLSAD